MSQTDSPADAAPFPFARMVAFGLAWTCVYVVLVILIGAALLQLAMSLLDRHDAGAVETLQAYFGTVIKVGQMMTGRGAAVALAAGLGAGAVVVRRRDWALAIGAVAGAVAAGLGLAGFDWSALWIGPFHVAGGLVGAAAAWMALRLAFAKRRVQAA